MTDLSMRRPRSADRSLWKVFAAPTYIAIVSLMGLVSALIGDGMMDYIAWIGLGIPVAVTLWYVYYKR